MMDIRAPDTFFGNGQLSSVNCLAMSTVFQHTGGVDAGLWQVIAKMKYTSR